MLHNSTDFAKMSAMERETKNSIVFGGSTGAHTAKKPRNKKSRARKWLIALACVLVIGVAGYLTAVYSQIPFIRDLREMYIQTAMSTLHHHWLATSFIPGDVIDQVMDKYNKQLEENMTPSSDLPPDKSDEPSVPVIPDRPSISDKPGKPDEPPEPVDPTGIEAMLAMFPEIDPETIPDEITDFHDLQISDIVDMGILTTAGDQVWAIDMPNQLLILYYRNSDFTGKLAIVRDPTRVKLALNKRTNKGSTVTELCEQEGAVLGVNAGGFLDPEGKGRGNIVEGLLICEGELLHESDGGTYQACALDWEGNLRLGYDLDYSQLRYAVEFQPIIVLNGELHVNRSYMSKQPRTCFGQARDGSILLLIIEGRSVTTGLGASVETCAKIMLNYDCYNAINLDGGSSSSMTYMGKMITKSSSPMSGGRTLPNAWVVLPPQNGGNAQGGSETGSNPQDTGTESQ